MARGKDTGSWAHKQAEEHDARERLEKKKEALRKVLLQELANDQYILDWDLCRGQCEEFMERVRQSL